MRILVHLRSRTSVVLGLGAAEMPEAQVEGLLPDSPVALGDASVPLLQIRDLLLDGDEEQVAAVLGRGARGCQRVGAHLYSAIFGNLRIKPDAGSDDLEVRLLTADEHLLRLPWNLLHDSGQFLSSRCGISLSGDRQTAAGGFSASPTILIAAPDPDRPPYPPTQAAQHFAEVEAVLPPPPAPGARHARVRTWAELVQRFDAEQPSIFYYYGHGAFRDEESFLVFERDDGAHEVPLTALQDLLAGLERPPAIVYLNCCHGDAGGFLGAGVQLRDHVPAVILNRTRARVAEARALARGFWSRSLDLGSPPHVALLETARELRRDSGDARWFWMAPVLHASYERWTVPPARGERSVRPAPDPLDRFAREPQLLAAEKWVGLLVHQRTPGLQVLLWHGERGQGHEVFRRQLRGSLETVMTIADDRHLEGLSVGWPDDPSAGSRQALYEEALASAGLAVGARAAAGAVAQAAISGLLVDHELIEATDDLRPSFAGIDYLRDSIEWWRRRVIEGRLPVDKVVLSFGFVTAAGTAGERRQHGWLGPRRSGSGASLTDGLTAAAEVDDVELLPPLTPVDVADLSLLLQATEPHLTSARSAAASIVEHTGGAYEAVLRELESRRTAAA